MPIPLLSDFTMRPLTGVKNHGKSCSGQHPLPLVIRANWTDVQFLDNCILEGKLYFFLPLANLSPIVKLAQEL